MKSTIFIYRLLLAVSVIVAFASCEKKLDELTPHNVNFEDQQFLTKDGFLKATVGNYAAIAGGTEFSGAYNLDYLWLNLSEFRGNNIKVIDAASTNALNNAKELDAFTFTNSALKDYSFSHWYWRGAYRVLLGVNLVLKNVKEGETNADILNAKGENLFLRSVLFFDLVRLYGRPYYQSPETNLGIPLILAPITDINARPSRATVKETYDQIIKDLEMAAQLMYKKPNNSFANRYAAYALLSRVYLYMGGTFASPNAAFNTKAKQYADSVIINGGYSLLQGTAYANYYTISNQTNAETIWAMNHTVQTSITSMTFQYPTLSGYTGSWARPSKEFLNLLETGDLRNNYYKKHVYPGNATDTIQTVKYGINYTAIYTNSPTHYLRLAEVYLNRAEARVKTGDNTGALADLNVIRVRAGLLPASGLAGQALFDEILKQRRIELAFEGHNSFDYFRNGLTMVRNYSSFNSTPITIPATDPKVVLRIPQDEINFNPNLVQNDQ
ncbi:MAG TPA: RagB/SusD family nutrient uptake outer membrane protein [Chitinophagaceae bacterium]